MTTQWGKMIFTLTSNHSCGATDLIERAGHNSNCTYRKVNIIKLKNNTYTEKKGGKKGEDPTVLFERKKIANTYCID